MTATEPIFIAQTAKAHSSEKKREWIVATSDRARAKGVVSCRVSVHETIPNLILFEGWNIPLHEVGDQGDLRFNILAGEIDG